MLKGKDVILAPLKREYIDKFLEWLNDPEVTQHLMRFRPLTREMEEDWFDSLKDREGDIIFAILINQNQLIGNCSIMNILWNDRVGTCGIFIGDKKEQGKGYGTEAMKLLLEYGFNTLNLNRIDLKVNDFNSRAIRCYQKIGFIEEGRMRQSCFRNGEYHDQLIMSILHSEWKGMNP
ncbi:MAG: N-acetyltransferase [Promethearchaeota archaeon]|nr:MAG: N-acetyltransferase [Candidatus Lokiarchaeota archaeon]